jgi:hypothetical protein
VRIGTFRTVSEEAFCEVHTLHSPGPTPPGQTALAFAGWGTPPEGPPFPSYSYHFPTRLLSNHKSLYEDHSFAVYTLALLGTTISVSLSRAPLIPPPRISAPAFLFVSGRSQAYTPARWKRFSLPLAKKVAKTGR